MKKLVLAVAALGLISLTSCKKDYTCACSGGTGTAITYPLNKMKKKDAQTACDTWNNGFKVLGGSCSLK